jgi:hypothetical protein
VGFKRIPVPFRVPHSPESRRRGRRGKVRGLPIRPKADYLKEVGYEINDEAASLYMADNKRDYTPLESVESFCVFAIHRHVVRL